MEHERVQQQEMLTRYRRGQLSELDCEAFEIHLLECRLCQRDLAADEALAVGMTDALKHSGGARSIARTSTRRLGLYAAAASVLLVLMTGVAAWLTFDNSRKGSLLQEMSGARQSGPAQIVYLNRTRDVGDPQVVPVVLDARTQSAVLVLDAGQPELREYSVDIRRSAGDVVWSTDAAAPAGSNARQIVVLVPTSLLASGQYEIVVDGRTESGRRVRSAEFEITIRAR